MADGSTRYTVSSNDITIVIAGKPHNGKSTALNNIFELDFDTGMGAMSLTLEVTMKTVEKNGITLHIMDTPGLGARDIKKKDILNQMAEDLRGLDYTLLYCLSVSPSSSVTELDRSIVASLHNTFGVEIWDKCVLLTFSDYARAKFKSQQQQEYIKYIRQYARSFQHLLKENGAGSVKVRLCSIIPVKRRGKEKIQSEPL